jgi:Domain of unknown function (DUF4917)
MGLPPWGCNARAYYVPMATNSAKDPFDGSLAAWSDVEGVEAWDGIVLGNGASISVWTDFQYASLFEQAKASGLFSAEDEELFNKLGAENFEEVLHSLSESIRVGKALGQKRAADRRRRASIQKALAKAVQRVHISAGEMPEKTFEAIYEEMRNYRHVFTTSYDLILYWAAAKGGDTPFNGIADFLWADGHSFDESTIWLHPEWTGTRLYFLHGALHLVILSDGTTRKRTSALGSLLDQFGERFRPDHAARPLVVTEASASDKLRRIDANDYLSYCWRTLRELDCPLVVFGHSLSAQDGHLVDALNEHPKRPLAVSLLDGGAKRNRREMHRMSSLLDGRPIYFFDSKTHPLGSDDLAVREIPWRRSILSTKRNAA